MMSQQHSKVEIRKSQIHGLGIFAVEKIPKNEVILEWHPKLLTPEDIAGLTETERERYLFVENGQTYLQQEPERYVNHSCSPNSYAKDHCDIALRDIEPGEEITSSYTGAAPDKFICNCQSSNCRHHQN